MNTIIVVDYTLGEQNTKMRSRGDTKMSSW